MLVLVSSTHSSNAGQNCLTGLGSVFENAKTVSSDFLFSEQSLHSAMGQYVEIHMTEPKVQTLSGIFVHNGLPQMVSTTYPEARISLLGSDGRIVDHVLAKDRVKISHIKIKDQNITFHDLSGSGSKYSDWTDYSDEIWALPLDSHLQSRFNHWAKDRQTIVVQLWAPIKGHSLFEGTPLELDPRYTIKVMSQKLPRDISLRLSNGSRLRVPLALIRDWRVKR